MTITVACDCGWRSEPQRSRLTAEWTGRQHAETCGEWAERVAAAGLPAQRTDSEWVAHPTALDDLMRVMGGTAVKTINFERRRNIEARERPA